MQALKTALASYVENDFKIVMNKYVNEMSTRIMKLSVENGKVTEKEITGIMTTVMNEFVPNIAKAGGVKKEESPLCSKCTKNPVCRKKEIKPSGLCFKCHKEVNKPKPINKDDDGNFLKCIQEKKGKSGESCGKNCCGKSDRYCATHFKAQEKKVEKSKAVKVSKAKKSTKDEKKSEPKKGKGKKEPDPEPESEEEEESESDGSEDE